MKRATVPARTRPLSPLNLLNPLSYLRALLPSSLKLRFLKEENIHESQGTFCRSSCSFFSMASSCDTFSSRFPGESLQPRHNRSHAATEFPPFSARKRPDASDWLGCFYSSWMSPVMVRESVSVKSKFAAKKRCLPFSYWVLFYFLAFFRLKKTRIDSWRTFTQWIRHAST